MGVGGGGGDSGGGSWVGGCDGGGSRVDGDFVTLAQVIVVIVVVVIVVVGVVVGHILLRRGGPRFRLFFRPLSDLQPVKTSLKPCVHIEQDIGITWVSVSSPPRAMQWQDVRHPKDSSSTRVKTTKKNGKF